MKTKILKHILLFSAIVALFAFDIPTSWFAAGSNPKDYDMGIDKGAGMDGSNAATIKSKASSIDGFGTLMQNFAPDNYLGKRIRMSGYIKSKDISDWAGFWLRVDQQGSQQPLSFDNMGDRPIKGTTEWKKYEIVLDVPDKASNIAFGALLSGTGQIWFDNLKFEVVDNSVPTTPLKAKADFVKKEPSNLDFETK